MFAASLGTLILEKVKGRSSVSSLVHQLVQVFFLSPQSFVASGCAKLTRITRGKLQVLFVCLCIIYGLCYLPFLFWLLSAESMNRPLHVQRASSTLSDAHGDGAQCFTLYEMEEATKKFEKRIGSGGFGIVYYGKTREGKEIAVKVLGNNSCQGKREFENEVYIYANMHHKVLF